MQTFDVVVVGAGLVGASFALALAQADLTVALIEPQPPREIPRDESWDSRVYAVSPGNADWLASLGLWQRLPETRVQRVERMLIFGDRAPGLLEFSAYDAGMRELAWIAENRLVQHELWGALEAALHVTLYCPATCRDIAWMQEHAVLALADGREIAARLVVGADGPDSWVRSRMGVSSSSYDYGELGVVANFATTAFHNGAAFQWFRADGVLALLPLPGHRVSMVWSTPEAHGRELLSASPAVLARTTEQASDRVLGELTLVTPAAAFTLRRQRIERLVEPRAALIGDAAHNVHPLAGQGVNLGFRDARELAAVLRDRGPQRDCGDYRLLRRYERARKEDIAALDLTTHGLEKLFGTAGVWMAGLRNVGLAMVDAQPLLKNLMVRRAAA